MSTLRLVSAVATLILTGSLTACGPSSGAADDDDDGVDSGTGGPDAYVGPTAKVTGRVWMPNYSPDQAAGQEIPVFGALVYLSGSLPEPIPQQVYCEECVNAPGNAKFSSWDGSFEIDAIPGTWWLVIQKGQFRLEQQITVGETPIDLPASMTTLPSRHDPANGQWMPKMAIVIGTNDNIEDVLGKVGVGNLDTSTWDFQDGTGENGAEITIFSTGQSATYFDLNEMRKYHIMFFPCNVGMSSVTQLTQQTYLKNIRTYVNEGGKIYVTDWSGEVMDRPFPPQITLGDSGTDSTGTYDPATLEGTLTTLRDADGSSYDSPNAEVVDDDLDAWLGLQMMPTETNSSPQTINPDAFIATHNWNWIADLTSVQTGVDEESLPVYDDPKAWVIGSGAYSAPPGKLPLTVTFEPTGCGRVLFSTYQTAGGSSYDHHAGLYPQERILLYLIMEIGICNDVPIVE